MARMGELGPHGLFGFMCDKQNAIPRDYGFGEVCFEFLALGPGCYGVGVMHWLRCPFYCPQGAQDVIAYVPQRPVVFSGTILMNAGRETPIHLTPKRLGPKGELGVETHKIKPTYNQQ